MELIKETLIINNMKNQISALLKLHDPKKCIEILYNRYKYLFTYPNNNLYFGIYINKYNYITITCYNQNNNTTLNSNIKCK